MLGGGDGRRSQRGVSLIEVAVAMTVMAMLLLAVAPEVGKWIRSTRIRSTAESLQNGIQKARMEAIRRNTSVSFWLVSQTSRGVIDDGCALSSTSASWVVSINTPAGKCASDPGDTADPRLIEKFAAGDVGATVAVSARATAGGGPASSVTFDGFGRVTGAGIQQIDINNVVAGNDYRRLGIEITTGGNVRLCEPAITAADDPRKCANVFPPP